MIFMFFLTAGCQSSSNLPSTITPLPPPTTLAPKSSSATVTPNTSPAIDKSESTPSSQEAGTMESATLTASPTPIGPLVVLNGGFDSGIGGWDIPYGILNQITSDYHTGPGAARLQTSDFSGLIDYRGNVGQCIDLSDFLDDWPVIEGLKYMTLEAYLRTGPDITNVSLNGIFLDDNRCGTGQAGFFDFPPIDNSQEWVKVSGTTIKPETARSLHVFINASGATDTASVLIDDIRAYATDYQGK